MNAGPGPVAAQHGSLDGTSAGVRLAGPVALVLTGASIAAFAVVMALGPSAAVPGIGPGGPLVWLRASPPAGLVIALERLAALAGVLGTATGLAAVRRGWRPPVRLMFAAGVLAAGVFALLPPAGSTDVLNYAVYGRIASLGHSPYLFTPAQLYRTSDPVGLLAPAAWRTMPTVYGPVATAAQWAAAELGGGSMARIVFWIRLGNALAFIGTAAALLRLAGPGAERRIRVCLLWTINPLMLFWLIGSGHVDVLIALLTASALITVRHRGAAGGLAGGLLAGAAIAIKLPFAFVAAGLAWHVRGSVRTITAAAGAAAALLGLVYLLPGAASTSAPSHRLAIGARFIFYLPDALAARPAALAAVVLLAAVAMAALLAWRLPPDDPGSQGVRLMLALAVASLVVLPVQTPWYDALIFVLLPLMPAGGLDYLLLARCLLLTELVLPGAAPDTGSLSILAAHASHAGLFGVLAVLIVVSLRGAWGSRLSRPEPV